MTDRQAQQRAVLLELARQALAQIEQESRTRAVPTWAGSWKKQPAESTCSV